VESTCLDLADTTLQAKESLYQELYRRGGEADAGARSWGSLQAALREVAPAITFDAPLPESWADCYAARVQHAFVPVTLRVWKDSLSAAVPEAVQLEAWTSMLAELRRRTRVSG